MEFQSRWWQLAAVQVGGAICLPIFVVGHELAARFGLVAALVAVSIGNLILLLFAIATALYTVKTRQTTAEVAQETFGVYGKFFFAILLIISMMGWFAVQLDMMGSVAGNLLGIEFTKPFNGILGGLIIFLGFRGIKGVELLAKVCLPLLILTVGYAVFDVTSKPIAYHAPDVILYGGISVTLAACMGAVIDLPTFFKEAKNRKDALIAVIILFGVAVPILEGVGIYLAVHGASDHLINSLVNDSSPILWKVWVALFVIMAGWTTNSTNLYSAVTSLKLVVTLKERSYQLVLGVLGIFISMLNIQDNLFFFLECIGILFAAGGGAMILNQLTLGKTLRSWNMGGLFLGIVGGLLSLLGLEISGSGFIDAFLIALLTAFIGCIIVYKKRDGYETNRC